MTITIIEELNDDFIIIQRQEYKRELSTKEIGHLTKEFSPNWIKVTLYSS